MFKDARVVVLVNQTVRRKITEGVASVRRHTLRCDEKLMVRVKRKKVSQHINQYFVWIY